VADIGGTITTTGDSAYGFSVVKRQNSSGDIPEPDVVRPDAFDFDLTGSISTSGADAHGVYIDMDGNSLRQFITLGNGGEIAVTGAGADAIRLDERTEETRVDGGFEDSTPSDTFITLEQGSRLYSQQGLAISDFEGPIEGTGHELTLTVAGTIDADDDGAISVQMGNASDTLILEASYDITGIVDGGSGDDSFVLGGDGDGSFDIGLVDMNGAAGASDRFVNFERFAKRGTGTWTLTGTTIDAFANGISVEEGLLNVATDLSGIAFFLAGGTLGGTGTLSDVTATGGTLAPGTSIGTLSTGSLSLDASSVFEVEVDDMGNSDLLIVNGTVSLGGATLDVVEMGTFAGTDPFNYLIIDNDAADAVNGTFGTIQNDFAFLTPTVSYTAGDGNDVGLTLTPNNMGGMQGCNPDPAVSGDDVLCTGVDGDGFDTGTNIENVNVLVQSGAVVTNTERSAISLNGNANAGTLSNEGTIRMIFPNSEQIDAVKLRNDGSLINAAGGLIEVKARNSSYVAQVGDDGSILNLGTIRGTFTAGSQGLRIYDRGTLVNAEGALLELIAAREEGNPDTAIGEIVGIYSVFEGSEITNEP